MSKRFLIALVVCVSLWVPSAPADEGKVRFEITPQSLRDDFFGTYASQGYRPLRLTGYRSGNAVRYFSRWVKAGSRDEWWADFDLTAAAFQSAHDARKAEGYYPHDASGYGTPDGIRYAAIWYKPTRANPAPTWVLHRDITRPGMQELADTIGKQGWVPHRVEAYDVGGQSHYISIWYSQPGTGYAMHNQMDRTLYQQRLQTYSTQGYKLTHVHAHAVGGSVYYAGIWKTLGTSPEVRTDRDWHVFQRYYNNQWAGGSFIDNFYAAATPSGVRYGGIWYFDAPIDTSTLTMKIRKAVNSAAARGGAYVWNLTTGEQISSLGDQSFAIASTSKIGILYALLKEIDLGTERWDRTIRSGDQYGANQCFETPPDSGQCDQTKLCNGLKRSTDYSIEQMAQHMIRCSNNWATNRLIQRVGRDKINQHLALLGLSETRIHRFMTGAGAPSAHGNDNVSEDRAAGWENLSTPREMVTLLKKVLQDSALGSESALRFWQTLKLDGDTDGVNEKKYIARAVASMNRNIAVFNKPGDLTNAPRFVHADAARLKFPNGQEVLLAVFMDDIADDPDNLGSALEPVRLLAQQTIRDVAGFVVTDYSP
jgi:beta-lactamase class A